MTAGGFSRPRGSGLSSPAAAMTSRLRGPRIPSSTPRRRRWDRGASTATGCAGRALPGGTGSGHGELAICQRGGASVGESGRPARRLGIGVVPVQGESFPSWVDRMAIRMRTGPGWIVRALGVELLPGGASEVLPASYGISMSPKDLESVYSATGVTPDVVSAMLLSMYDGTVLD